MGENNLEEVLIVGEAYPGPSWPRGGMILGGGGLLYVVEDRFGAGSGFISRSLII